ARTAWRAAASLVAHTPPWGGCRLGRFRGLRPGRGGARRPSPADAPRLLEDHAPVVAFEAAEEAARVSLVAGDATHLLDLQEDAVLVAVDQNLLHPLHVPGGVALDPEPVPPRAPVGGLPGGERGGPRYVVHVRHPT